MTRKKRLVGPIMKRLMFIIILRLKFPSHAGMDVAFDGC